MDKSPSRVKRDKSPSDKSPSRGERVATLRYFATLPPLTGRVERLGGSAEVELQTAFRAAASRIKSAASNRRPRNGKVLPRAPCARGHADMHYGKFFRPARPHARALDYTHAQHSSRLIPALAGSLHGQCLWRRSHGMWDGVKRAPPHTSEPKTKRVEPVRTSRAQKDL